MTVDQLAGDRGQVCPDVVRLRPDAERRIALAKDEGGLPASCRSADRVPDMAGDQADVAGIGLECGSDRPVGLGRWLVAPDGLIDAETPLE